MIRRLSSLLALCALGACADTAPTAPPAPRAALARTQPLPPAGARGVTVMTRNLYLGADILSVATVSSPAAIPGRVAQLWGEIQGSNFPERAGAIAREIAASAPALVGLQEVPIYRIDPTGDAIVGGTTPATVVALDFLAILRDSLASLGLRYDVAATQQLTDVELPALASLSPLRFVDIRYTDRDVILAAHDVATRNPSGGVYAARLSFPVAGLTIEALRGWVSTEATIGGVTYRFVNTHLETPASPAVQVAQAQELAAQLQSDPGPIILVGDLNSAAAGTGTASYGILTGPAGFVDVWREANPRDPGYTSSLPPSLFGPANPTERLDLILVRQGFGADPAAGIVGGVQAAVIGEEPGDRTASGRWPSDHAGVVAVLRMPRAIGGS